MKKAFYVIGMRQEVVCTKVPGDDYFENHMVDGTMDVFHLYLIDLETNDVYDFSFWTEEGWCGSGYTTATWGCYDFTKCKNKHESSIFNYTYAKPDKKVLLDIDDNGNLQSDEEDDAWGDIIKVYDICGNTVVAVNDDGGDAYYPSGGTYINEVYFHKIRGNEGDKRKVYIFTGPSGIGKSYLTSILINGNDADLYDTDEQKFVDNDNTVITATYVVIGQKNPYPIESIVKHIYDRENTDVVVINMGMFKEA